MSARLLPSVLPSVEIHTSTFDVGEEPFTAMVLCPGLSAVAEVSTVVSPSFDGFGEADERISTLVPVLEISIVTAPTTVGLGSCSINPTPFLKLGNGTGSV